MVNYKCFRCGKDFRQKCHLLNHLCRKNPCKSVLKEISNKEILTLNKIEEYNTEKYNVSRSSAKMADDVSQKSAKKEYKCKYCEKKYKHRQSKFKHEKKCKDNKEDKIKYLEEKVKNMEKIINKSNKNHTINITNNNIDNRKVQNNNIQINNFDKENLSYISGNVAMKIAKNFKGLLSNFIDLIHFNEKHPENHNIRIKDIKNGMAEIRDKNKWKYLSMDDFLDEMRLSIYDKLETLKENICEEDLDLYDDYIEKVDEILEDMKKVKLINKKIKIASINGTNKIHKKVNL